MTIFHSSEQKPRRACAGPVSAEGTPPRRRLLRNHFNFVQVVRRSDSLRTDSCMHARTADRLLTRCRLRSTVGRVPTSHMPALKSRRRPGEWP
jgi:hypothetical protein